MYQSDDRRLPNTGILLSRANDIAEVLESITLLGEIHPRPHPRPIGLSPPLLFPSPLLTASSFPSRKPNRSAAPTLLSAILPPLRSPALPTFPFPSGNESTILTRRCSMLTVPTPTPTPAHPRRDDARHAPPKHANSRPHPPPLPPPPFRPRSIGSRTLTHSPRRSSPVASFSQSSRTHSLILSIFLGPEGVLSGFCTTTRTRCSHPSFTLSTFPSLRTRPLHPSSILA